MPTPDESLAITAAMPFEELLKRLRKPKTPAEKDFAERCYEIGMKNGWCSGRYAMEEGDFIVEEDRLNKNSISVVDDVETLREFFIFGNWCLGTGIIYKNLCFIQQIDGGDEWLAIKTFVDGTIDFESISWRHIIKEHGSARFSEDLGRLLRASKDACKNLEY